MVLILFVFLLFFYSLFLMFRNNLVGKWITPLCDKAISEVGTANSDYELEQSDWYLDGGFDYDRMVFNPLTYHIWTIKQAEKYFKDRHYKTIPDTISKEPWK